MPSTKSMINSIKSETMISRFYDDGTEHGHWEITSESLKKHGHTPAIYQGTGARCTLESVRPLYRSQMPMTLSPRQLDGTPCGLFLAALERGDKAGLFECMANLEDYLGKFLRILEGRSTNNCRLLSALQHFAESYGLHLPSAWIREYRRSRRNKSHAKV